MRKVRGRRGDVHTCAMVLELRIPKCGANLELLGANGAIRG